MLYLIESLTQLFQGSKSKKDMSSEVPRWLSALLSEKFFNACLIHEDHKKNEKNVFCFDCCVGVCPYCFSDHPSHRLLQIRRYMYHDVIRLREAEELMDCAQVQYYITNSAKVVFLNRRPPTRAINKTCSSVCININCHKNLQDSYIFCCLYCKLQHLLRNGSKLSRFLRNCNFPTISEPGLEDGQLTPDSVLENSGSDRTVSDLVEYPAGLLISATAEFSRKKRSINHVSGVRSMFRPVCAPVPEHYYLESESVMNRRKGTPHRSPLY